MQAKSESSFFVSLHRGTWSLNKNTHFQVFILNCIRNCIDKFWPLLPIRLQKNGRKTFFCLNENHNRNNNKEVVWLSQ